jgi:hypothetical protein
MRLPQLRQLLRRHLLYSNRPPSLRTLFVNVVDGEGLLLRGGSDGEGGACGWRERVAGKRRVKGIVGLHDGYMSGTVALGVVPWRCGDLVRGMSVRAVWAPQIVALRGCLLLPAILSNTLASAYSHVCAPDSLPHRREDLEDMGRCQGREAALQVRPCSCFCRLLACRHA